MKANYSLMFVTDDTVTNEQSFFSILESALQGGASIIQLREKRLDTKTFYAKALKTKLLCKKYNTPLIINDRIDIALAVDADGVHIGQKDMPYWVSRDLLGEQKIIGISVSTKEQAIQAELLDVDYIGISPIFSTTTKTKDLDTPLGLEGLKAIRQVFSKSIVSIGGVNKENAAAVLKNGSDGLAVISAISRAENPQIETETLKNIICKTGIVV